MERRGMRLSSRFRPGRVSSTRSRTPAVFLLAALLFSASMGWAGPTTTEQAANVTLNWLSLEGQPMGSLLGLQVREVKTYYDDAGEPVYYVAFLDPTGLVFLPADDLVEPIIGFVSDATTYDPSQDRALEALVSRDIPARVQAARAVEAKAPQGLVQAPASGSGLSEAQQKWAWLQSTSPRLQAPQAGISSISDVRVAPLISTKWGQTTVNESSSGLACYNYYTPPGLAGTSDNYPCGCTATAMAQVMRYFQYPSSPVVNVFSIRVNGFPQYASIRGGNGTGGAYDWTGMIVDPLHSSPTAAQRQAIGALMYDAGVSVGMEYAADASGAWPYSYAFRNTFRYTNAIFAYDQGQNFPTPNRNAMINSNLNANYPVVLGIESTTAGHAVVCDGYGYNASTMYHHINMGWIGTSDAWYNLPTVSASGYNFTSVDSCTYNIFTTGTGEIISGRVTDSAGNPISGVTVTATLGSTTYNAVSTTSSSGVFAIPHVPSNSTFTVSASKTGRTFGSQTVKTGTSVDTTTVSSVGSAVVGNLDWVDFVDGAPAVTLNVALDNSSLTFTTSGGAAWHPQTSFSYLGGSAAQSGIIGNGDFASLQTTVTGPGTLSFYWKVSSEDCGGTCGDFLDLIIDSSTTDRIKGERDWTLVTKTISAGSHTIAWRYGKNGQTSAGSDAAWLDDVVFTSGSDTIAPSLAITSHTNNQHVITSTITLSGTAGDSGKGDSGIQQVTVNGTRADNDTATGSGTATWSKAVTLTSGSNTFTVIAYDNSTNHNSTTQTITIYCDLPDPTAPSLSITSHTDNQHVITSTITLSGTASDSGKGDSGIQQVTVNGIRADNDTATGSGTATWSKAVTLSSGSNTITVVATDNSASHSTTTQVLTIFLDGQPTVDSPAIVSLATTSATLGANISSGGGSTVTASGIAYATTANPTTSTAVATYPTVTSGAFTVSITSLTPNTLYHYRGFATNSSGTGYTADATFTTVPNAPTAKAAIGVGLTTFTAVWNPPSGSAAITGYQLDVATNSGFTSFVAGFNNLSVAGTSRTVAGLSAGTYYYRVRAVNAGGTSANSNTVSVSPQISSDKLLPPLILLLDDE